MDQLNIDVPTATTAILTLVMAVGGILVQKWKGSLLTLLSDFADLLVDIANLLITISKAGEDGQLTADEWTNIKTQAREIQEDLLRLQGKLGGIVKLKAAKFIGK
jgi:hypothetical protein